MNTYNKSESSRNNRLLLLIVAIIVAAVFVDASFGALPNPDLEPLPGMTPLDQSVAVSALRDLAVIQDSYVQLMVRFKDMFGSTLSEADKKGLDQAMEVFKAKAEAYRQSAKLIEEWKHPKLTPPSS